MSTHFLISWEALGITNLLLLFFFIFPIVCMNIYILLLFWSFIYLIIRTIEHVCLYLPYAFFESCLFIFVYFSFGLFAFTLVGCWSFSCTLDINSLINMLQRFSLGSLLFFFLFRFLYLVWTCKNIANT